MEVEVIVHGEPRFQEADPYSERPDPERMDKEERGVRECTSSFFLHMKVVSTEPTPQESGNMQKNKTVERFPLPERWTER